MKNEYLLKSADTEQSDSSGTGQQSFVVCATETGMRVDLFLAAHCPDISRSRLAKMCKERQITVNKVATKASLKLNEGDEVCLYSPAEVNNNLEPDFSQKLDIIYEDEDVLLINKPAGLMVHPGSGREGESTLAAVLLAHNPSLKGIGDEQRPGLVHRLDRDTSGIMVTAKNKQTLEALAEDFSERRTVKVYLAFVSGRLKNKVGRLDNPIGRHPVQRHKMANLKEGGREALSFYRVLRFFPSAGVSLVAVKLITGRTHQARVHLQGIGHPIIGDEVYSRGSGDLYKRHPFLQDIVKRQMLHARSLSFNHPSLKRQMRFTAPWPEDFINMLKYLLRVERSA